MVTGTSASLERLLDHARRTVPFYAARLSGIANRPAADVLADLPLLSRYDIRREGPRLWSAAGDPSTWRAVRTSGTTGEPLEVLIDEEARLAEAFTLANHVDRSLRTRAWRQRTLFHLTLHVGSASGAMPAPWNPTSTVVKWNLVRAWQARDASFLRSLVQLHGHVVTAMPSVAELIASRVELASAVGSVVPSLVVLSGETLDEDVKARLASAFACPVTSLYTLAEAGILATSCPAGGLHVEDDLVVVEILDEFAHGVQAGTPGEIVITPLLNRAMPLIRYRTGDRACWEDGACGCGRSSRRLVLTESRRPVSLVSTTGATVNAIRFAKVIAGLDVDRIGLTAEEPGVVRVRYQAERAMGTGARSLLESVLRNALGPATSIVVERERRGEPPAPNGDSATRHRRAEPVGPSPAEVAAWLAGELAELEGMASAVLTGSYLDPEATTRFSDIDTVVLLKEGARDEDVAPLLPLVRRLRGRLPALRVNVDLLQGLPERAPLLACRLLGEQLPVLGKVSPENLPWPSQETLLLHARVWVQEAQALVWTWLSDPSLAREDVLRSAWLAAKQSLEALRYRSVARGERVTAPRALLELARAERMRSWEWLDDVSEAFDVAREHVPPLHPAAAPADRYLRAALACLQEVSRTL
jgi:phenylacetate-CoA ligase